MILAIPLPVVSLLLVDLCYCCLSLSLWLGGLNVHAPKGPRFASCSGHMPRSWFDAQGWACRRQAVDVSHIDVFLFLLLSLSLPRSKIIKHFLKIV